MKGLVIMTKMELGRTPAVFVSSTCYDLKQIRNDIRDFISEDLGYEAILSEFDSFPLEPEISAVENCIRTVKQRADIFCLIIGGRYGSIANNGKSITNLEYIHAKAKGIPIYVFVEKTILAILPVWEKNRDADFSDVVDNTKLFEFVSELRGKENIWVYGFENAQDIIKALRRQLAYLFYDSLKIRKKIHLNSFTKNILQLEGKALKIIIEKPTGWEYLLLGEILEQSLNRYIELKRDLIYGLSFGGITRITEPKAIMDFISDRVNGLLRITNNMNVLFEKAIPDAIGAPGEPGEEEKIIYVGKKLGDIYESLLKWGLEFKSLSVEEDWIGVVNAISKMWQSPVTDLDKYIDKYKSAMEKLALCPENFLITNPEPENLDLTLVLNAPNIDEYLSEMEKLRAKMGVFSLEEL